MKFFWDLLWIVLSVGVFPSPCALALVDIPPLNSPVIDQGGMLDPQEQSRLATFLKGTQQEGGPQLQFWSVSTLDGEDIAALAIRAADVWKLGRADKDDGGLLLLAVRERKSRLEVGQGLEGFVPDAVAARLLRNVLKPALQKGNTFEGVSLVFEEVVRMSRGEQSTLASAGAGKKSIPTAVIFIFLAFIALLRVGSRFGSGVRGSRSSGWGGGGWGGGGGFGGSGGGGGWGGGGGGFSGGGSSGDW